MNNTALTHNLQYDAVQKVMGLFAPQWPLDEFVAVNPWWGHRSQRVYKAEAQRLSLGGCAILPSDDYLYQWARRNNFEAPRYTKPPRRRSVAATHWCGQHWTRVMIEIIERGCSLFYDKGQAAWMVGDLKQHSLLTWWRIFASTDKTLSAMGASDVATRVVQHLSEEEAQILLNNSIPIEHQEAFVFAQMQQVKGWCSYIQHQSFEENKKGIASSVSDEFALIVIAYALAILDSNEKLEPYLDYLSTFSSTPSKELEDYCKTREEILEKIEDAERKSLFAQCSKAPHPSKNKTVGVVFCIDVRSERYRRALEKASSSIQTIGFAGFFGLPVQIRERGSAISVRQLPVLLSASIQAQEELGTATIQREKKSTYQAVVRWIRQSIAAGFSYVEAVGITYLGTMLRYVAASFGWAKLDRTNPSSFTLEISKQKKAEVALQILKNSGLLDASFETVVLCGHTATTCNNPFHAGLTCGACGGHGGLVNASLTANLLNDPETREVLKADYGVSLRARFVAAIHDTTTDRVQINADIPEELSQAFATASQICAVERAQHLDVTQSHDAQRETIRRACDWAEIQPEWGLAGNTAFIAARRSRTEQGFFDAKTFLHEYDTTKDENGSVLELIMTAPMVVAHWINMQYFASSAHPNDFGAGSKVIHNVVGQLGVVSGNGGDLRLGLPWQSVATENHLVHQPRRLSVLIEAPKERILNVMRKHQLVRELVVNGWISLWSLDYESSAIERITN